MRNSNLSWTGVPERQEREREWGKRDNERDPDWEFSRSDEKHQFINSKIPREYIKRTIHLAISQGDCRKWDRKKNRKSSHSKRLLLEHWWLTSQKPAVEVRRQEGVPFTTASLEFSLHKNGFQESRRNTDFFRQTKPGLITSKIFIVSFTRCYYVKHKQNKKHRSSQTEKFYKVIMQ